MKVRGVRGATTVKSIESDAILRATRELLALMIEVNDIRKEDIASVIVTATSELDAQFPVEGVLQLLGPDVPLLSSLEIDVPGEMPNCIRILVHGIRKSRRKRFSQFTLMARRAFLPIESRRMTRRRCVIGSMQTLTRSQFKWQSFRLKKAWHYNEQRFAETPQRRVARAGSQDHRWG